jgi:hypothetical protein
LESFEDGGHWFYSMGKMGCQVGSERRENNSSPLRKFKLVHYHVINAASRSIDIFVSNMYYILMIGIVPLQLNPTAAIAHWSLQHSMYKTLPGFCWLLKCKFPPYYFPLSFVNVLLMPS